jgi:hypothetical protein
MRIDALGAFFSFCWLGTASIVWCVGDPLKYFWLNSVGQLRPHWQAGLSAATAIGA